MTWLDKAEDAVASHKQALHIIEAIGKLARETIVKPSSDSFAILQAIERTIHTFQTSFDGKVTRAEVDKQIATLAGRLASNDTAEDADLTARFDTGGNGG